MAEDAPQPSSSSKVNILGDLAGGVNSAVLTLPTSIVSGLLAFSPLGPEYASMGVLAGLYGTLVTSIIAAVFGGSSVHITGARSSLAVIMGAVLAGALASSGLPTDPQAKADVAIILMFFCVFAAGIFQVVFGLVRMGRLIKYLPRAVISGLMNGFAIFILLKQVPVLFGVSSFKELLQAASGDLDILWIGPLCGFVAAGTTLVIKRIRKGLPGGLLAIVLGSVLFHLLGGAQTTLAVVGAIPAGIPEPADFTRLISLLDPASGQVFMLVDVLGAALALAFLGSVLSLLSAVATDSASNTRHDSNRELFGQGLANMAAAMLGGVASGGAPSRSIASVKAGANSRLAGLFHGLFFVVVLAGLGGFIGQVPLVVLAGVLIMVSISMLDTTEFDQARQILNGQSSAPREQVVPGLITSVLVTVVTLTAGFVVAAGIGMVGASLMFAMRMEKVVVRGRYSGDKLRSKTSRPRDAISVLEREGCRITVLEAQGAVFFGSADKLARQIEEAALEADYLILGLRGVTEIDDTALKILRQMETGLIDQGKVFQISYLHPESPLWSTVVGLAGNWDVLHERTFPDTDSALSWAEDHLLEDEHVEVRHEDELALKDIDLLNGLSTKDFKGVKKWFKRRTFKKGEAVVCQGDPSDEMFLLAGGTVSILVDIPGTERQVRLAHLRPGVMFGEMGLITGDTRSTHVRANDKVVVHVLDRKSYEHLSKKAPEILAKLLANISIELAERLRVTSAQVSELERNT